MLHATNFALEKKMKRPMNVSRDALFCKTPMERSYECQHWKKLG